MTQNTKPGVASAGREVMIQSSALIKAPKSIIDGTLRGRKRDQIQAYLLDVAAMTREAARSSDARVILLGLQLMRIQRQTLERLLRGAV
jgi:hypothetical protein